MLSLTLIRSLFSCPAEPRHEKGKARAEPSSDAGSKNPRELSNNTNLSVDALLPAERIKALQVQIEDLYPVDYDHDWNWIQTLTGVDNLSLATLQFVSGIGVIAGLTLLLCSEPYIVGLSIFGGALFLLILSRQLNTFLEHRNMEKASVLLSELNALVKQQKKLNKQKSDLESPSSHSITKNA